MTLRGSLGVGGVGGVGGVAWLALHWPARVGPRHCGLFGRLAGSTSTCIGVPDAQERADLIAYLARVNRGAECGKPAR